MCPAPDGAHIRVWPQQPNADAGMAPGLGFTAEPTEGAAPLNPANVWLPFAPVGPQATGWRAGSLGPPGTRADVCPPRHC